MICDETARVARIAFDSAPPGAGGGGAAAAGGGGPPPGFAPLPQKDSKVDAIPDKLNRSELIVELRARLVGGDETNWAMLRKTLRYYPALATRFNNNRSARTVIRC